MSHRPMISIAFAVLIPALAFFGCARRPVATAATAPAPTRASSHGSTLFPGSGGAGSTATGDRSAGTPAAGTTARAPGGTPGSRVAAVPPPSEFVPARRLADIHFDFDRADIRAADRAVLDNDATWMRDNAQALILIEGHADERGTTEYNLALGEQRAEATRNYLVAHGVAPSRIMLISYGEERPQCTQHAESCWSKNRRSHFLVKSE